MDDLTAFQRDLLYTIAGIERPYGLKVKRTLEEYYTDEINHSRLYQNMNRLIDDGFLEKGTIDDRTTLRDRLEEIREQGYAFSDGEAVLGVESVGVAFEAPGGRWNALGVFGYAHDLGDERLDEDVSSLLQSAAADLEATLQGTGADG
jgi:DNA-binding IclR family transcriptional regulator